MTDLLVKTNARHAILIEPFGGGSHQQFVDLLAKTYNSPSSCHSLDIFTLPGKKWHWRLLVSAAHFATIIPNPSKNNTTSLFASSMLNLCELLGMRPDLSSLHKVYYFHENQLTYPSRQKDAAGQRDWALGWNQIVSSLVADVVLFNSSYNRKCFLDNIPRILSRIPKDCRPSNVVERIQAKSDVLFFPLHIKINVVENYTSRSSDTFGTTLPLHIVWAHRWEFDKNPDLLFRVLLELKDKGFFFFISILGESFKETPEIFKSAREKLNNHVLHWGYLPSRKEYLNVLRDADVALSTADHEFFGVSTLECAWQGYMFPGLSK
eukprot:GSMAST32.ASY1.ANO1.594.1 assembled CDS